MSKTRKIVVSLVAMLSLAGVGAVASPVQAGGTVNAGTRMCC